MESDLAKVLHLVAGMPMLHYVLKTAEDLGSTKTVVVVGHQAQEVQNTFSSFLSVEWVLQSEMKGTGDAVKTAKPCFDGFPGPILILYGDIPGIRVETLRRLRMLHDSAKNAVTLLTADLEEPTGYGRVVVAGDGLVARIVEEKDATLEEKEITEVNTGIGFYDPKFLWEAIDRLKPTNQQGEYYLTDVISDARTHGRSVGRMQIKEPLEALGINDRSTLSEVTRFFEDEKAARLLESGVSLDDPGTTSIHPEVQIGRDSVLQGRVLIEGKSVLGKRCIVDAGSRLSNVHLGERVKIGTGVYLCDAEIGDGTQIGSGTIVLKGD
ncbi:MAG: bifunctional N-acetylglucosamine-1-phosphate uridyltransferase/glucosamine-1-phosphate acetyltransferase [Bdellovibrionales bacterium]|nr:bifunctional N-acetylglucosamine-1-phosphate uridyltransferase/glucosamine-1-phosphate acetyltransferase [Bdellovibrionales bacterium]